MASNRIGRINEEIQRELSALIRTVKDPRVHGLVSITAVDTTSDLRYSKIYVSVLDKSDVSEVVKGLKSAGGYLRRELGRTLNLRNTPELSFVPDDSIDHGARILSMLRDPEVMYAYEHDFSAAEVQSWLDRQINRYRTDGFGLWAIVSRQTGSQPFRGGSTTITSA